MHSSNLQHNCLPATYKDITVSPTNNNKYNLPFIQNTWNLFMEIQQPCI